MRWNKAETKGVLITCRSNNLICNSEFYLSAACSCRSLSRSFISESTAIHGIDWDGRQQQRKTWLTEHIFSTAEDLQSSKSNNPKRSSEFLRETIFRVGGRNWAFLKEVYSLGSILCANCFDRGCVYLARAPSCLPDQRQGDLIHLHGYRNRGIIWDIVVVIFL